jgi:hypothetical protein
MKPELRERIRLMKLRQAQCQHEWKKMKRTWMYKGEVSEVEKVWRCPKCRKEMPRNDEHPPA